MSTVSASPECDAIEVARYEDLRSCANRTVWTIQLQIRRLRDSRNVEAGDEFVLQAVSDAEFLILALDRLLAVARQIDAITAGALSSAIAEYQRAFPNLRTARNVVSHMDEYLHGDGRDRSVRIGSLSTHVVDPDHLVFAGFEFNIREGFTAAERLFSSIRSNQPNSYRHAVALADGLDHR